MSFSFLPVSMSNYTRRIEAQTQRLYLLFCLFCFLYTILKHVIQHRRQIKRAPEYYRKATAIVVNCFFDCLICNSLFLQRIRDSVTNDLIYRKLVGSIIHSAALLDSSPFAVELIVSSYEAAHRNSSCVNLD